MMRQLLQVAGTVLLDIEITVKLVTQSKVNMRLLGTKKLQLKKLLSQHQRQSINMVAM